MTAEEFLANPVLPEEVQKSIKSAKDIGLVNALVATVDALNQMPEESSNTSHKAFRLATELFLKGILGEIDVRADRNTKELSEQLRKKMN